MYVWFAPTMTSLVSEYLPCGFRSDLPTNDSSLGHCGLVRAQGCWARTTDPAGALVSEGPGLVCRSSVATRNVPAQGELAEIS